MSRLGKIARLPRAVRDTLNVRLQEGEHGPALLAWLNAEPTVQAVLVAHFGGHAINAQNLSDWRRGGYAAWCQQQEILELAGRLHEDKPELDAVLPAEELAGCFAQASLLALMRELKATWGMEEGTDRRRAVLAVVRAADRLQRRQLDVEQAQRERAEEARPVSPPPQTEAPPLAPPPATTELAHGDLPLPDPSSAALDDEQSSALFAAAMAFVASLPDEAVPAIGRPGPKHPALQAA